MRWNVNLPPRLAVQEQRKQMLQQFGPVQIYKKYLSCFNVLAHASKLPELVAIATALNSIHEAGVNGRLPLTMPVPFVNTISLPKLKYYDEQRFTFEKFTYHLEHRQSYLDRYVDYYASVDYEIAKGQIDSLQLPEQKADGLRAQLSTAHGNLMSSVESTSRGSDFRCSDDCYHPYKDYGSDQFLQVVKEIESLHKTATLQNERRSITESGVNFFGPEQASQTLTQSMNSLTLG